MINETEKGFTLIELLVVIAIIGVLSSIVLASLNDARGKGGDAAVKEGLSNARSQIELTYIRDSCSAYNSSCGDQSTDVCVDTKVVAILNSAALAGGGTQGQASVLNPNRYSCRSFTQIWAISAPLKTGNHLCLDSAGNVKVINSYLLGGVFTCP